MKAGLFVGVGALAGVAGGRTVDDFAGLADRAPVVSAAFAILAFALVGVPPAVGFAGKWHIVLGAVEGGRWGVASVAVVSTLLTLAYFARVVERMYFRDAPEATVDADASPDAASDGVLASDGGSEPAPSAGSGISTEARLVVVAAAVGAVVLGLFASDLVSVFEPVLEVYFE
jgi:multicomponent Na+:H+ antiporter subunit D